MKNILAEARFYRQLSLAPLRPPRQACQWAPPKTVLGGGLETWPEKCALNLRACCGSRHRRLEPTICPGGGVSSFRLASKLAKPSQEQAAIEQPFFSPPYYPFHHTPFHTRPPA